MLWKIFKEVSDSEAPSQMKLDSQCSAGVLLFLFMIVWDEEVEDFFYMVGIKNVFVVVALDGMCVCSIHISFKNKMWFFSEKIFSNWQVCVDMGALILNAPDVPTTLATTGEVVKVPLEVDGKTYTVTCVSMGNSHCVTFGEQGSQVELLTLYTVHHLHF